VSRALTLTKTTKLTLALATILSRPDRPCSSSSNQLNTPALTVTPTLVPITVTITPLPVPSITTQCIRTQQQPTTSKNKFRPASGPLARPKLTTLENREPTNQAPSTAMSISRTRWQPRIRKTSVCTRQRAAWAPPLSLNITSHLTAKNGRKPLINTWVQAVAEKIALGMLKITIIWTAGRVKACQVMWRLMWASTRTREEVLQAPHHEELAATVRQAATRGLRRRVAPKVNVIKRVFKRNREAAREARCRRRVERRMVVDFRSMRSINSTNTLARCRWLHTPSQASSPPLLRSR